jgi:hypothetical protein
VVAWQSSQSSPRQRDEFGTVAGTEIAIDAGEDTVHSGPPTIVRGRRRILFLGRERAAFCGQVAFFRSTVPHFGESIALVSPSQEGLDSILPEVDHPLALGRDVVPTICGKIPCVRVPLATAESSLADFGAIAAVLVGRQRIHNFPPGSGEVGS